MNTGSITPTRTGAEVVPRSAAPALIARELASLRRQTTALLSQVEALIAAWSPAEASAPGTRPGADGGEHAGDGETFGEALRRLRLAAGMSQPVLAERVFASQSLISKVENGREVPSQRLAEASEEALAAPGALVPLLGTQPPCLPNRRLAALVEETRWPRHMFARRVTEHAAGAGDPVTITTPDVTRWVAGRGIGERTAGHVVAVLSARLGRPVTVAEAGLTAQAALARQHLARSRRGAA